MELLELMTQHLKDSNIDIIQKSDIKIDKPYISEGGFGKVYRGSYKNIIIAIKKFKKCITYETSNEYYLNLVKTIINEIQVINKAQHPSFPKFYGISYDSRIYFIFEFINGDTLKNLYKTMDKSTKLCIILQIMEILNDIHSKKIIHRDIKPQNIMIEKGNKVRLIDFGISRIYEKTLTFTGNSTYSIHYTAPEVLDPQIIEQMPYMEKPMIISPKIDVWSVGCIISEIFSNVLPWTNICRNEVAITRKLLFKFQFPIPNEIIDDDIKLLIHNACMVDYKDRPTAIEFLCMIKEVIKNLNKIEL